MKYLIPLICGTVFGAGLALSGMTDTSKVLGFLDLFGAWDATLAFVMASALLVSGPAFYLILKKDRPLIEAEFSLPTATRVDPRLLTGAAIFGVGWGIYGWCPGPAIASLAYLNFDALVFTVAMLAGMFLSNRVTA